MVTRRTIATWLAIALLATAVHVGFQGPALAQATDGALDRIADSGELRIGYRTDARPLSFEDEDGEPAGYVVDMCRRIATAVGAELGRDDIQVRWVPVTTENRLRAVVDRDIDIECGSTTITIRRMQSVDFTLMTFVTGGTVLSRADNAIRLTADLAGKRVAVIRNTSTSEGLNTWLTENLIDAEVVNVANRAEGMAKLRSGEVDGFASDQIVLIGEVMEMDDPEHYAISQELFSYEPYALMVPRDDAAFRLVVNRALAQLFRSGQYVDIFNRWVGWAGIRPSRMLVDLYGVQELPE